mmetsp:Transcript_5158/g.14500  ORF Transcript_5158/g.14500 Transcript_5158/m.14500 type:complete len:259 (+) Transcript_5158:95-871(+)
MSSRTRRSTRGAVSENEVPNTPNEVGGKGRKRGAKRKAPAKGNKGGSPPKRAKRSTTEEADAAPSGDMAAMLAKLQANYEELRNLRETEAETLAREMQAQLQELKVNSENLVQRLQEEKAALAEENARLKEAKALDTPQEQGDPGASKLLSFLLDLTGLEVRYCDDFETEAKKGNRRFSTATMERETKPFFCSASNADGSNIKFYMWVERDEVEYRPVEIHLSNKRDHPEFLSDEIVFDLDQAPLFLGRLLAEVNCDE